MNDRSEQPMRDGLKRWLSQQRGRSLPPRNTGTKLVLPKPEGARPAGRHSGSFVLEGSTALQLLNVLTGAEKAKKSHTSTSSRTCSVPDTRPGNTWKSLRNKSRRLRNARPAEVPPSGSHHHCPETLKKRKKLLKNKKKGITNKQINK